MDPEGPRPAAPPERIEVRLPSRASYLGAVRSVVKGLVEECLDVRLTDEEIHGIQLSLQEACINVVRHAHRNDPTKPLVIGILPGPDRLVIEIEDFGPGLPETPPPDPNPEAPREGGYGLFIMRETMDEVRSVHRDGKHVLILAKRLRREATPPAPATPPPPPSPGAAPRGG
jgi:serine/threonine-protein kinase RsbW